MRRLRHDLHVGAVIRVGSPKTHELRSVPYPELLELAIAKLFTKPIRYMSARNQILIVPGPRFAHE